jgi:hypothetical protein
MYSLYDSEDANEKILREDKTDFNDKVMRKLAESKPI